MCDCRGWFCQRAQSLGFGSEAGVPQLRGEEVMLGVPALSASTCRAVLCAKRRAGCWDMRSEVYRRGPTGGGTEGTLVEGRGSCAVGAQGAE